MITIRAERPGDEAAVRSVNLAAFETAMEADLVDALRASAPGYSAYVARDADEIVGHVAFTTVTIEGSQASGMSLAPLAVLPARQRQGIGSRLARHGLEQLRQAGCPFVVVVGHPAYYPRFGFEPASQFGIGCPWPGIPDDVFLLMVLDAAGLPRTGGMARFASAFDAVEESTAPAR